MNDARGFTLIEIVLVIIIIGILAAAVAPMALSSVRAYNATLNSLGTLDKLRYATERLARELREVNYNGTSYDFASNNLNTTQPVFTTNTGSGAVTVTVGRTPPTVVTLKYSTVGTPPADWVLTDQVSTNNGLTFTYFDKNGTSDGVTTTTVRYVEISLTLTQGSQPYSQRTRVELKNR